MGTSPIGLIRFRDDGMMVVKNLFIRPAIPLGRGALMHKHII